MSSLADELPAKIKHVQDEILPAYESIGAAGQPAIQMVIKPAINDGIDALASGDAIRMLAAYTALNDIKL